MKIIAIDNFDRETVSDVLVAESLFEFMGGLITAYLNDACSGSTAPSFYRLVDDDYKLYVFSP